MQNKVIKKIVNELEKRGPIRLKKKEKVENYKFVEKGHIDSISLIKFTINLEKKFNISFSEKETFSKEFGSVKGLAKIIKIKLKKNKFYV